MADQQNSVVNLDERDKLLKEAKDYLLGLKSCLNKYAALPECKDFLDYPKLVKPHMDFLELYITKETSGLAGKINSPQ